MKNTKQIQQLYEKLLETSEIPIIEADIFSKGIYMAKDGKKEIYLKQSLSTREKLKVLLHEYGHYIHLNHYFQNESRAECEMIANSSAFIICKNQGLNIYKEPDLSKFSDNKETIKQLKSTIQAVSEHIHKKLED